MRATRAIIHLNNLQHNIRLVQEQSALQNKVTEVHIKVDTCMGRTGCSPDDTLKLARLIIKCSNLKLAGVCTHFPSADTKDKSFTQKQIEVLKKVVALLKNNNINPGIVHAANSGAIIDLSEAYFDMVRPGIMLYGYYPSQEQKRILPLKPVMELVTKVVFIKKVKKGTPVSYGMTYKTGEETKIATLPLGYADGYNRLLSNKAAVLVNNKCYKISGRICMDQCMINIGLKSDIKLYEDVTLFGPNSRGPDGEEIALLLNTIPYEVTCNISKRVPRIYLSS